MILTKETIQKTQAIGANFHAVLFVVNYVNIDVK